MSEILKRQDSLEQRKKLTCLLFMSPIIQKHNDFSQVIILKKWNYCLKEHNFSPYMLVSINCMLSPFKSECFRMV